MHLLDYLNGKSLPTSANVFAEEAAVNTGKFFELFMERFDIYFELK